MVVLCVRHGRRLGKREAQVTGKFIDKFFREEKKCLTTIFLFIRAELVGTTRN